MIDFILGALRGVPAPLATYLVAMLPSLELSVAIPLALEVYHLPVAVAFALAVLGSFTPALVVLTLAPWVVAWLMAHSPPARRLFTWVFDRTRKKFAPKYHRWGDLALLLFVAIPLPLPLSGAWTGALAAFLFDIPARRALPLIGLGLLIAGGIMIVLTLGFSALR